MSPRALLAWAWTLLILIACWLPPNYLPVQETGHRPLFIPNIDKLVHLGIFAVFAYLWMRSGEAIGRAERILLAGVSLAVVSELGQNLPMVHRDANVIDGLADILGLVLGLGAFVLSRRLGEKRKEFDPLIP